MSADWGRHVLQTWRYTASYATVFIEDKSSRLGQCLLQRDTDLPSAIKLSGRVGAGIAP